MNKSTFTILILLSLIFSTKLLTQWLPDVRLTNDTNISQTSIHAGCIANSGNYVHVVWEETRDGNSEVYYKRSIDGGTTWGTDTRLTNDLENSASPSIAVNGSNIYIVWAERRNGNDEIYYKNSTDNGLTWSPDARLTNNTYTSQQPCINVLNSNLHIMWIDNRDGNNEIYYKRSTNSGFSWGSDIRLTNNSASSFQQSLTINGIEIHAAWTDTRDGINGEIYYKKSTNNGTTWGQDIRLTNHSSISQFSTIRNSGQNLFVFWEDSRSSNYEIYYKNSMDGGESWGTDVRLTNTINSRKPHIEVSGNTLHVIFLKSSSGHSDICYKRSTDSGVNWEPDLILTSNSLSSENTSIFVSNSTVNILWTDLRHGNGEIYYKKNPTGNPIGIMPISNEIPEHYNLMQNFPNPFNPQTNINFDIPIIGFVKLVIYDVNGRVVETLVENELNIGKYSITWNAEKYASGIYFYRIITNDYSEVKKMILIK